MTVESLLPLGYEMARILTVAVFLLHRHRDKLVDTIFCSIISVVFENLALEKEL
jgi:hypothetical protein